MNLAAQRYTRSDDIDGSPRWSYMFGAICQLTVFPPLLLYDHHLCYYAVISYFLKDTFTTTMHPSVHVHHFACIFILGLGMYTYSMDIDAITIAVILEIGSGGRSLVIMYPELHAFHIHRIMYMSNVLGILYNAHVSIWDINKIISAMLVVVLCIVRQHDVLQRYERWVYG